jgi:hypothetical protein
VRQPRIVLTRLIGRWVQEAARNSGGTDADFQGQGQPATGKTRHATDITVSAKPPARKVGSKGGANE